MPETRFPLGRVVAPPGALNAMEHNQSQPLTFLARPQSGDWGDLDAEDRAENECSVE